MLTDERSALAAKKTLDALGLRIDALGANDSPNALAGELRALVDTPCFALARDDGDARLRFASGLSLRTWWKDGGGAWLGHYLAIGSPPGRVVVATSPLPRTMLSSETAPAKEPLRPLLCPATAVDDRTCGTETARWRVRADQVQQHLVDSRDRGSFCAETMRADASGKSPYAVFRSCLNDGARKDVMPLGVFQAPKDGWFIVARSVFITDAGCRDAVAAYDLATGAAYLVGCFRSPPARLATGRVPLGALREAAWMSMLEHTTENVRTDVQWFDAPQGVVVARRPGEIVPSRRLIVSTSDAPVIDWAWVRGSANAQAGQASGRFDTSDSSLSAHAAELLRIVDEAFEEGCAPAPAPRALPWNDLGPIVTSGSRPDAGGLFHFVDQAKTTLANAPRRTAPCSTVP